MIRSTILLYFLYSELSAAPLVIGHRAGMGHFPQASRAALEYSVKLDIQFIELDLRLSADDVPVVHHDTTVNPQLCVWQDGRVPSTGLAIAALTVEQLKQLRCGIIANPRFPDQTPVRHQILTLQEVLTFIATSSTQVELMLELKRVSGRKIYPYVRKVLTMVQRYGLSQRVNLQSADARIFVLIKKMAARLKVPLINDIVAAPQHLITPRRVAVLQRFGMRVVAYTVNSPQQWEQLLQAGVDGIITDYPRDLQQFIASRAYRFSPSGRSVTAAW